MGRIVVICRLVLGDLRRHPGQAAIFLLAVTAATATLALGLALNGATSALYRQTRAATAGPDVVVTASQNGLTALESQAEAPGVVGHNGPYPVASLMLTANGFTVRAVVAGAATTPGPIDRPLVTSGSWVRPGGIVVERGFATALGLHVGDRVTTSGHTFPVVGIAVTAADTVYPWAEMIHSVGGPQGYAGLAWLTTAETEALTPLTRASYALDLKLADPNATQAFVDSYKFSTIPVNHFTWQFIAHQDSVLLKDSQAALDIGGWLLSFLAISGVAGLAAGRAAQQTRRAGLLKAVGATPGLIATILLAEYLALGLLAAALGLTVAWATGPALIDPSAGLISTTTLTASTTAWVTFLALAAAALTTLGPALRALRTDTVHALADSAHSPAQRAPLTALSAVLPTPLLLGLRLTVRRPRRALLQVGAIAGTVTVITALLILYAQPIRGYDLGASTLSDLRGNQTRQVLLAVTAAVIALAIVNVLVLTWSTALDARRSLAIARVLGATPAQVTAGLSIAALLPALPGAVTGTFWGIGVYWFFSAGRQMTEPPLWWIPTAILGTLLAVATLTAIPARTAAHQPLARSLSAEAR